MTDYGWFPFTSPSPGTYQWNSTGNWTNGAFWANATTVTNPPTTGTVPGSGDGAYIVSANAPSFLIPGNYSRPPYNATVVLNAPATITTLGLGQIAIFSGPPSPPNLDIFGGSLDVTGQILDTFTKTFPAPVGTQTFTGGGVVNLATAGRLEVGNTIGAQITISFNDASADTVVLDGVTPAPAETVTGTFTGFQGANAIDLPNIPFVSTVLTSYDPVTGALVLTEGGANTVQMVVMEGVGGPGVSLAPDSGTGTQILVTCFADGTFIRTPDGEIAVERLRAGDSVITLVDGSPVARPVRWVGQRRIDVRAHPQPDLVAPIRITAGAIGAGVPARELSVSPDHALFLNGVLVPARLLVNGRTIVQDLDAPAIRYFHVELDHHAVLLAEGLAAESYLDTGNRALFENGGIAPVAHPDLATPRAKSWDADACAPLATDPATVEPIWRRLAARAVGLGHAEPELPVSADDPGLWVEAAGGVALVVSTDGARRTFALPEGTGWVRLRSDAFRPSDRMPWLDDRRRLGVSVARLVAHGPQGARDIPLDGPELAEGWWETERAGDRVARWTNGSARLPVPAATRRLEVHLAG